MKTCIFVVGARNAGKSSIVRALTGFGGRGGLWNVRNKRGTQLSAFVILSAVTELGGRRHSPNTFPETIERRFHIRRRAYKVLICPFELRTWRRYSIDRYINRLRRIGFNVKIAAIGTTWDNRQSDLTHLMTICRQNNINPSPLILNANNDQNTEAGKIRRLYP